MSSASVRKSIDPDKLDSLSESQASLSELTGEFKNDPSAWVEDASKDKLLDINTLLADGSLAANDLMKSLGTYLKNVGTSFREQDLEASKGIESNGSSSSGQPKAGTVYKGRLSDPMPEASKGSSKSGAKAGAAKGTAGKAKSR